MLVGEERAIGVAVEGDTQVGLVTLNFAATTAGCSAPQFSLMLRPSGLA